jgi:hypothetical protein
MMQKCYKCAAFKEEEEFSPSNRGKAGYICRACNSIKLKKYYSSNKEKYKDDHLRRYYGVTLDWYKSKMQEQKGVCTICGFAELATYPSGRTKSLSVDHSHTTGVVRGLLCTACNMAIGMLHDSPAILRAAADYLERWEELHEQQEEGTRESA